LLSVRSAKTFGIADPENPHSCLEVFLGETATFFVSRFIFLLLVRSSVYWLGMNGVEKLPAQIREELLAALKTSSRSFRELETDFRAKGFAISRATLQRFAQQIGIRRSPERATNGSRSQFADDVAKAVRRAEKLRDAADQRGDFDGALNAQRHVSRLMSLQARMLPKEKAPTPTIRTRQSPLKIAVSGMHPIIPQDHPFLRDSSPLEVEESDVLLQISWVNRRPARLSIAEEAAEREKEKVATQIAAQ
jgi:uncharacterized protein DUF3486